MHIDFTAKTYSDGRAWKVIIDKLDYGNVSNFWFQNQFYDKSGKLIKESKIVFHSFEELLKAKLATQNSISLF